MSAEGQARSEPLDFIVDRTEWRNCRFVEGCGIDDLDPGQVALRIDRFALTSNNISYAAAGDMLGYWNFFPATEGWGRIPAFGFADVVRSTHPGIAEGERYFGYFPMSRYLVVAADQADPRAFIDVSANRAGLSVWYNTYRRVDHDPYYLESAEARQILLSPLFMTGHLIDDFLAENDLFGAESFVIASASSKTAIALAHELSKNTRGEVVGLTSSRNRDFVSGLGFYDKVVLYDELETLDAGAPTVFVDMAGNASVVARLHRHFAGSLKHSCAVGATHAQQFVPAQDLPGPAPEFFFAPSQAEKRLSEWGTEDYERRVSAAWAVFRESSVRWLNVEYGYGRDAVRAAYLATLAGGTAPNTGTVLSLWDENVK